MFGPRIIHVSALLFEFIAFRSITRWALGPTILNLSIYRTKK